MKLSASEVLLSDEFGVRLFAQTYPTDASISALKWSSSNEQIVSVTADGVLTRHKEGAVTITASATDGSGVSASCQVMDDQLPCLKFPAALTTVDEEAWLGNSALQGLDLMNVKKPVIKANAFKNCTELKKVLLPAGASIADTAFNGCGSVVLYCSDEACMQYAKDCGLSYAALISQPE